MVTLALADLDLLLQPLRLDRLRGGNRSGGARGECLKQAGVLLVESRSSGLAVEGDEDADRVAAEGEWDNEGGLGAQPLPQAELVLAALAVEAASTSSACGLSLIHI